MNSPSLPSLSVSTWRRLLAATALIAFAPILSAGVPDGIVTFDVPQAGSNPGRGTIPLGVSQTGAVIGDYRDSMGTFHGFVRARDGGITVIDVVGAGTDLREGTLPHSINPSGAMTGYYIKSDRHAHGFARTPDGVISTFDVSGAIDTLAVNINARGVIAGFWVDPAGGSHGFLRDTDGSITKFDVPGAGPSGTYTCSVTCLNAGGDIAGFYFDANNVSHGFLRRKTGAIELYDVPGAGGVPQSYQGTYSAGINDGGTIAGAMVDANSFSHGFVRTAQGAVTTFDVPEAGAIGNGLCGGPGTVPAGLNASDAVVGCYTDQAGASRGFLRSRDGVITLLDVLGAGITKADGTFANGNNSAGVVTGTYIDSNHVRHGFLFTEPAGSTQK